MIFRLTRQNDVYAMDGNQSSGNETQFNQNIGLSPSPLFGKGFPKNEEFKLKSFASSSTEGL